MVKVSAVGKPLVIWKAGAKASPPPGTKVDVGGYSLYIHCSGQGSPTVILDGGMAGTQATGDTYNRRLPAPPRSARMIAPALGIVTLIPVGFGVTARRL